jgi:hypothetical protein
MIIIKMHLNVAPKILLMGGKIHVIYIIMMKLQMNMDIKNDMNYTYIDGKWHIKVK